MASKLGGYQKNYTTMTRYVLKRLMLAIPTLFGVLVLVFMLTHIIGDPVTLLLPPEASIEQIEALEQALGLDKPMVVQFVIFLKQAVQGDFGDSLWQGRPAAKLVFERLPATLELTIAAVFVAVVIGIPAGILAALARNSVVDVGISVFALFGLSMPNFWLGLMLILYLGVHLHWLPISGKGGIDHLVLPAITLGTSMMGILARLMRTDLLDVLSQEYITTAYAKGLGQLSVIVRHTVRNALIPTITIIGLQFGQLLGGAVVTETIFAWPGMGRLIIQAINHRDYSVIQLAVLLFAAFFVVVNLLVDLMYAVLNPRIKYD
jgi:peptide/nickel transport system permease protein